MTAVLSSYSQVATNQNYNKAYQLFHHFLSDPTIAPNINIIHVNAFLHCASRARDWWTVFSIYGSIESRAHKSRLEGMSFRQQWKVKRNERLKFIRSNLSTSPPLQNPFTAPSTPTSSSLSPTEADLFARDEAPSNVLEVGTKLHRASKSGSFTDASMLPKLDAALNRLPPLTPTSETFTILLNACAAREGDAAFEDAFVIFSTVLESIKKQFATPLLPPAFHHPHHPGPLESTAQSSFSARRSSHGWKVPLTSLPESTSKLMLDPRLLDAMMMACVKANRLEYKLFGLRLFSELYSSSLKGMGGGSVWQQIRPPFPRSTTNQHVDLTIRKILLTPTTRDSIEASKKSNSLNENARPPNDRVIASPTTTLNNIEKNALTSPKNNYTPSKPSHPAVDLQRLSSFIHRLPQLPTPQTVPMLLPNLTSKSIHVLLRLMDSLCIHPLDILTVFHHLTSVSSGGGIGSDIQLTSSLIHLCCQPHLIQHLQDKGDEGVEVIEAAYSQWEKNIVPQLRQLVDAREWQTNQKKLSPISFSKSLEAESIAYRRSVETLMLGLYHLYPLAPPRSSLNDSILANQTKRITPPPPTSNINSKSKTDKTPVEKQRQQLKHRLDTLMNIVKDFVKLLHSTSKISKFSSSLPTSYTMMLYLR